MKVHMIAIALTVVSLLPAGRLQAADKPAFDQVEAAAIARAAGLPLPAPGEMEGPQAFYAGAVLQPFWQLTWTAAGEWAGLEAVSVTVATETRRVLSFSQVKRLRCPECESDARPVINYTRREAQALAEKWVRQLAPELLPRLRLVEPPATGGRAPGLIEGAHFFKWDVTLDGYPVLGRDVVADIDAVTGELRGFSQPAALPAAPELPPGFVPNVDAAMQLYWDALPLELQYRLYPQRDSEELQWRLVYRLSSPLPRMGLNGELVNSEGQPTRTAEISLPEPVPAPDEPWVPPAQPLTRDEALAVAVAATCRLEMPNAQYNEWVGGTGGYWTFTWDGAEATVDAQTGLLVSMSLMPAGDAGVQPLTLTESRALAAEFIRRFRPDLAGRLLMLPPGPWERQTFDEIEFVQTHEGVPLSHRTIRMAVLSGQHRVITLQVMPFEPVAERFTFLGAPANAISPEAARAALLKANPLELVWVSFPEGGELVSRLVWAPRWADAATVDALTGALLDSGGDELRSGPFLPADLADRPEARAVEILASMGVIRLDGDKPFEPDRPAELSELVDWLTRAFGAKMVKVEPGSTAARQAFALWVARAMGYGALADMKNRIEVPFRDRDAIGAPYANAVAILNGLGLLPGDGETIFQPEHPVTRGEAAKIICGALLTS
ncbi:MAG TPA: S-layer homology domain-containing protein [Symbiobacteriaceae bacterium]|nr:S-layer homology domain-containing protein [Symbiobacteriaceae bacterium]